MMRKVKITGLPSFQFDLLTDTTTATLIVTDTTTLAPNVVTGGTPTNTGLGAGGVGNNNLVLTSTTTNIFQGLNDWSKVSKTAFNIGQTINFGAALAENFINKPDRQRSFESHQRNNMFTEGMKGTNRGLGAVPNTGKLVPQLGGQGQSFAGMMGKYGGEFKQTRKVIIEEAPSYMKMAYGGQTRHSLDITRQAELRSRSSISEAEQYNKNLSEKKGEDFVLEGEKDELLWKPADYELYKFGGKFHSQGGTKLTAAQAYGVNSDIPSFIFSRVLKVPAKVINQEFGGFINTKKGMSPADIASKFLNLNNWNAILKDPNSTSDEKKSAEMSIAEISRNLAKLAIVHEDIKGKQAPEFAQQMLGMGEQQNQQMPPNQEMAKWGGNFSRELPSFEDRLLVDKTTIPTNTNVTVTTPFSQDYTELEAYFNDPSNAGLVNELYDRYIKTNKLDPSTFTADQYKNAFLTAQKHIWALRSKYDKDYLQKIQWDKGNPNEVYNTEIGAFGYTPMTGPEIGTFQNIYKGFVDAVKDKEFIKKYGDIFEIDPQGRPDQTYSGLAVSPKDNVFGNTTNNEWTRLKKKSQVPVNIGPGGNGDPGGNTNLTVMYQCFPVGKGKFEVKEVPASVGIGYKTKAEAEANCGKGFKPPFDFTTPAKMKMAASMLGFPTWDPGVFPNMSAVRRNTMLPVWDAAAQAAFATQYKAPAEMLAAYAAPQGLASNLAYLSGQAADTIGAKIIPQIEQQRVGIFNEGQQDLANELRRVQQFNINQKEKRATALATVNDKYADEVQKWAMNVADTMDQAWTQRSDISGTNALTNYYLDPRTGEYKFKPGYRNIFGANYSYPGSDGSATTYADVLKQNYDKMDYIKDEELRLDAATKLTIAQTKGQTDNNDDDWMQPGKSSSRRKTK